MPVILESGSEDLKKWLDPTQSEWTGDLQSLLKPFHGELEVYPVNKDVGKVGNNSPSFIIPVDSKENKSNIANFFANAAQKQGIKQKDQKGVSEVSKAQSHDLVTENGTGLEKSFNELSSGLKRKASIDSNPNSYVTKKVATSPTKLISPKKISATKNNIKTTYDAGAKGNQRITNFFTNSA